MIILGSESAGIIFLGPDRIQFRVSRMNPQHCLFGLMEIDDPPHQVPGPVTCVYVPAHLHHILFEVFKVNKLYRYQTKYYVYSMFHKWFAVNLITFLCTGTITGTPMRILYVTFHDLQS